MTRTVHGDCIYVDDCTDYVTISHTHNNICIWDVSIGELEDVCICDMYIESEVATVVFVHSLDTTRSLSFPA